MQKYCNLPPCPFISDASFPIAYPYEIGIGDPIFSEILPNHISTSQETSFAPGSPGSSDIHSNNYPILTVWH